MSRRKAQIDPQKVEQFASRGLSTTQIAHNLGVGRSTLYDHMRENSAISDAIDRGRAKGIAAVANALFEAAVTRGNYQAQQFYLRNRDPERWKDRTDLSIDDSRKAASEFSTDELLALVKGDKAA
jgi:IS30 family transposase